MSKETCAISSYKDPISVEIESSKERQGRFGALMAEKSLKTIDSLLSEVSYFKNLTLRQRAEMDNFVKAKEREANNLKEYANSDLIKGLLPALDSIDSAMLSEKDSKLAEVIRGQILKILSQYGFKPIEAKGMKFDPYFHEAVSVTENGEDGMIVEEIQRGYMLKGEVIRTSKVIVGKR